MRVRITYGVELEDVPSLASSLGYDALAELKQSAAALSRELESLDDSEQSFLSHLGVIEKIRLRLSKTDSILVDMSAILEGIENYYNGEQDVSERRPTMDPSGNTITKTEGTG